MAESKNASQIKHLRENYVRFPLDLRPEELKQFRKACERKGTKPTTEIKKFIRAFSEDSTK